MGRRAPEGLEGQKEQREHQTLGLLPAPKADSGSIQFSLSSVFSLENYITSQGEQRLPKPPNNTEIARREIPATSLELQSPHRCRAGGGQSGSSRGGEWVLVATGTAWGKELHLPRLEAASVTFRSQVCEAVCMCQH